MRNDAGGNDELWARYARVLFWAALAFTLFMALDPHPPQVPGAPVDKLQHSAAFVVLTVLAAAGFRHAKLLRIGERLSFLGAGIELVQSIPWLHRDCDVLDWLTDTVAIGSVLLVVWLYRLRETRPSAK